LAETSYFVGNPLTFWSRGRRKEEVKHGDRILPSARKGPSANVVVSKRKREKGRGVPLPLESERGKDETRVREQTKWGGGGGGGGKGGDGLVIVEDLP